MFRPSRQKPRCFHLERTSMREFRSTLINMVTLWPWNLWTDPYLYRSHKKMTSSAPAEATYRQPGWKLSAVIDSLCPRRLRTMCGSLPSISVRISNNKRPRETVHFDSLYSSRDHLFYFETFEISQVSPSSSPSLVLAEQAVIVHVLVLILSIFSRFRIYSKY